MSFDSSCSKTVFIVACEESGDLLGEDVIKRYPAGTKFFGVGGSRMEKLGNFKSLFDLERTSVMGFFEILPRLIEILDLIQKTKEYAILCKPDEIVTIDSPGFCFKFASDLRKVFPKKCEGSPLFRHIVAPSIWAYKPNRKFKVERIYDSLWCILPFEKQLFAGLDLDVEFFYYPPLKRLLPFVNRQKIDDGYKRIFITLGSREGEVVRHIKIIREVCKKIVQEEPNCIFVFSTLERFRDRISKNFSSFKYELAITDEDKYRALNVCDFGICKSGTNAMEAVIFDMPICVYYKVNFLTFFIAKMMMKTKFATLINIAYNKEIVKEFIQKNANPNLIASYVLDFLKCKLKMRDCTYDVSIFDKV